MGLFGWRNTVLLYFLEWRLITPQHCSIAFILLYETAAKNDEHQRVQLTTLIKSQKITKCLFLESAFSLKL